MRRACRTWPERGVGGAENSKKGRRKKASKVELLEAAQQKQEQHKALEGTVEGRVRPSLCCPQGCAIGVARWGQSDSWWLLASEMGRHHTMRAARCGWPGHGRVCAAAGAGGAGGVEGCHGARGRAAHPGRPQAPFAVRAPEVAGFLTCSHFSCFRVGRVKSRRTTM